MSFELPFDLGDFVIERRHAAGGMATVYAGWQKPPMKRPVAIKIMHAHIAEIPGAIERFEREAANGARVQHEKTVTVYHYGILEPDEGLRLPYLVMEWVDGFDVKRWLKEKHSPLPLEVALLVIRDVAIALEHAHACQVIHRDIKPSNVMLALDGRIKLMDFGLARAHDDRQLTDPGDQLGSYPYMSPEQARGKKLTGVDGERSDIFSMGSVSYELLAGEAPFRGQGVADITTAVESFEPPPIVRRNPIVPRPIAETIARAMRKPPAERCASMSEFLEGAEAAVQQAGLNGERQLLARYLTQPAQTAKELERDRRTHTPPPEPGGGADEKNREAERAREQTGVAPPRRDSRTDRWGRMMRATFVALLGVVLLTSALVAWRVAHREPTPAPPPETVQLAIESIPPGASVIVNGEAGGTTPRTIVGLPGDTVEIELRLADFETYTTKVTLAKGIPALRPALVPIPARTYSISTSPGSAEVYVDGAPAALSWPMKAKLSAGTHRFIVRHPGGEQAFMYEVRAGDSALTLVLHYDTGKLEAR